MKEEKIKLEKEHMNALETMKIVANDEGGHIQVNTEFIFLDSSLNFIIDDTGYVKIE